MERHTTVEKEICCVDVEKIYDWVTRFKNIKLKERISVPKKRTVDDFCCTFQTPCGAKEPTVLFLGNIKSTASVHLSYNQGCTEKLKVIINGKVVTDLNEGQSFCSVVSGLESIKVICKGEKAAGICCGKLEIKVHYPILPEPDVIERVQCFLSDCEGNSLDPLSPDSIVCEEISDPNNRKNVNITLPNGENITLQKVKILKKGFVVVKLIGKEGCPFTLAPIPFVLEETFLLCAPPGTRVECEITDFECNAFVTHLPKDDCKQIDISINLCQSIMTVANVKLEVEAAECNPRPDQPFSLCPPPMSINECVTSLL
ncbi:S-Ena type endospore appendage [Thermolongibacillus altinsuensis]|uniref:S-Ena type endospore appendage n=1 Tax=Thermolongibacillus altinsuensis TaxID=575256 RepID=UPI00242A2E57|nr:S-Ena type endospore appendage [Thermolongibacillus altinsuensis]GMB08205.1 hypothetical protein B1no1_09150 [Thermolongibacillus altinsuensis]